MHALRFPRITTLIGLLAIPALLIGCEAFNEHDQEAEVLTALGLLPGVSAPATPGTDDGALVCEPVAAVKMSAASDAASEASLLGADFAEVQVKAVDETAVTVTVKGPSGTLTMTIKQDGETYALCSAAYVKEGDMAYSVTGGEIQVAEFSTSDGKNAGSFTLSVSPDAGSGKAIQVLLGAKAATDEELTGTYFADTIVK